MVVTPSADSSDNSRPLMDSGDEPTNLAEIPVTSDMMWRMQSLPFLSALPALLGLAGFVLYPK
jgi:hypothetical protein